MKQFAQIVYRRLRATSAFSPLKLFAQGEQGVWYDPSDMTTLFQDAAGTTPVTAVEQPVGLVLDKSRGLVLGSELVTNGDFSNGTTGWTAYNDATISVSSGELVIAGGVTDFPFASTAITTVAGRTYRISATARRGTFTYAQLQIGTSPTSSSTGFNLLNLSTTATSYTFNAVFTATGTTTYINLQTWSNDSATAYWDNISVRELLGNHASQSTSASRPVLSARVNLLTQTEAFASWGDVGGANATTITSNSTTAPDGTLTADTITYNGGNYPARSNAADIPSNATMLCTARVQDINARYVYISARGSSSNAYVFVEFDLQTNTVSRTSAAGTGWTYVASSGSVTSTSNGFKLLSFRFTSGTVTAGTLFVGPCNGSANPNSSSYLDAFTPSSSISFYIWGADLRPANAGVNLPVYQRVGAATYGVTNPSVVIGNPDYDTNGFPMYLKFDGTDDSMATATINPGAVDKTQVFAGVRKLSDAATGVISELSADRNANNGAWSLAGPGANSSATYSFSSKGTYSVSATSTSVYAAPLSNVITGLGDISGDRATLRIDGTQAAQSTADQGTGNYLSYPLYIGRRGGTTLPFNGHLYSLVVRFSATNLPDATIAQTETWVNGKTYAYGPPVPSTANNLIWATGNNLIWDTGNNITWGNS